MDKRLCTTNSTSTASPRLLLECWQCTNGRNGRDTCPKQFQWEGCDLGSPLPGDQQKPPRSAHRYPEKPMLGKAEIYTTYKTNGRTCSPTAAQHWTNCPRHKAMIPMSECWGKCEHLNTDTSRSVCRYLSNILKDE